MEQQTETTTFPFPYERRALFAFLFALVKLAARMLKKKLLGGNYSVWFPLWKWTLLSTWEHIYANNNENTLDNQK